MSTGTKIGLGAVAGLGMLALLLSPLHLAALGAQRPSQTAEPAPYAGQQHSPVRGLSEEEMASYRAGGGMGLARPAEVNGYPGPRHVLALADELGLSDDQRSAVQALFDQVSAETVPLGERFLERYAALEQAFRDGTIALDSLYERTAEIGRIEGELRAAHLKYHLLARPLLTEQQIARYNQLRGYTDAPQPGHEPGQHPPARHGH